MMFCCFQSNGLHTFFKAPREPDARARFPTVPGVPRPPVVALMALVVGCEEFGDGPTASWPGLSRPRQYETRFCGGIMDGREDAPGAQRRDRHRRRPTLNAMTAACYAPDNRHYPPVAVQFNLLFQRMKVL